MSMHFHRLPLAAALALLLSGTAAAGGDKPDVDKGLAAAAQTTSVTLVLQPHDEAGLEEYIRQTVTPGSPNFQQFLSTAEFAKRFGASDREIARVQAFLAKQGLRGEVLPNRLIVRTSGTLGQFGAAFHAPIHEYAPRGGGRSFHRPSTALTVPSELAGILAHASGLSNEHRYLSHRELSTHKALPQGATAQQLLGSLVTSSLSGKGKDTGKGQGKNPPATNPTATGQPGEYTVGDVANFYDINPLYQRGIDGKGATVAIVTLSDFDPADAETYWSGIGLATKPNRITQVHVDGGGVIDDGSGETSLDVEQAGGLAPRADVLVYDAPNTTSGYLDALAQAVADNKADSISTSWGLPEAFNFAALNVDGASASDTSDAGDLRAFHLLLLEAAVQGQSVFAATGDSGAYDTVRSLGHGDGPGEFSAPLTVDSPASDPYITAAGGTTTPYSFNFGDGTPDASITQESVWGWDYLQDYIDTVFGPGLVDLFSSGGGGGVSVYWPRPFYQAFTRGARNSEANQSLVYNDPTDGPTTLLKLPGHFPGRNVPDLSLNADPETGYLVVSTVDGGVTAGNGGTSFVAPQLNGISALLKQSTHHRIGLWNPRIYLLQNVFGYGSRTPFKGVLAGDNWFYHGQPQYNPGAGIGTLDVANLDQYLRSGF